MWQRIRDWAALTQTEQRVLFILLAALLLGAGIKVYRQSSSPTQHFDYRQQDSVFAALSARAAVEVADTLQRPSGSGKVNLNTATKAELMSLPGIGEVMAERIMTYREDVGPFRSADDLARIKGISKKRIEQLRPLVTVH